MGLSLLHLRNAVMAFKGKLEFFDQAGNTVMNADVDDPETLVDAVTVKVSEIGDAIVQDLVLAYDLTTQVA